MQICIELLYFAYPQLIMTWIYKSKLLNKLRED